MTVHNVIFLVLSNDIFVGGSRSNSRSNSKSIHRGGNSKVLVIICSFPVETSVNVTSVSVYLNNCNGSICLNLDNNVTECEILNCDCIHSLICLSTHAVLTAH